MYCGSEESPGAEAAAVPGATGQRWHLSDLNKSLKKHMHALYYLYRLGYSNLESVYYQAWQQILPRADGPTSNAYIRRPPGITSRASRRVKQCCSGTAPVGQQLHRMGKLRTPKCRTLQKEN